MGVESKITTKGQTTIPIEVREYLKVGAGDRIGYEFVDGKVVLVPKNRSALDFAGVLFEPRPRTGVRRSHERGNRRVCLRPIRAVA